MEIEPYILEFYIAKPGKIAFQEWLDALKDRHARACIKVRLDRIRLGNLGDYKSIGKGVMELRIHYGSGFRVYFGFKGKKVILLLCGGDKSSQAKDIKIAQEYWEDFNRRAHHEKN